MESLCSNHLISGFARKAGIMKRKQAPAFPTIKVITDPKRLAWLKARIEKQKLGGEEEAALTKSVQRSNRVRSRVPE